MKTNSNYSVYLCRYYGFQRLKVNQTFSTLRVLFTSTSLALWLNTDGIYNWFKPDKIAETSDQFHSTPHKRNPWMKILWGKTKECKVTKVSLLLYQENTTILTDNCTEQCTCINGGLSCYHYQCNPNAVCVDRNDGNRCYCSEGYYGDGVNCITYSDCQDVYDTGYKDDDVYYILPEQYPGLPFKVYCRSGWTVSNVVVIVYLR